MSDAVRIGILGDFNTDFRSHHATNDALQHAARKLQMRVESEWLPTPSLTAETTEKTLERFDGLWASPGSPYKSFDGMLRGIEFARRRDWPFLGTCGGFQYAFIEFARNVLNIADADSATLPRLLKELEKVRTQGYAVDDEENNLGARCVGAPVFNQQGAIEASVGLSGTIGQVNAQTMPRIVEALKDAARHVSMQLGYRAPHRRVGA